jgi:hypothetical protein
MGVFMAETQDDNCLTCRFAQWKRNTSGHRFHISGDGRCIWEGWRDWSIPGSMYHAGSVDEKLAPSQPGGGYINRKKPVGDCPCWEDIKNG